MAAADTVVVVVSAVTPPIATCSPHVARARCKVAVVTAAAMVAATAVAQVTGVVLAVAMAAVTPQHGPAITSLTPCVPAWT